jgi:hypothetical protein
LPQPLAQPQVSSSILRVLLEPRPNDPNIWVATCLETGYIATGLGYNEARENIFELLRNEVIYAAENNRKLTRRSPIPAVLERKWEAVISEHPAETVQLFPEPTAPPKKPVGSVKQVSVARTVR